MVLTEKPDRLEVLATAVLTAEMRIAIGDQFVRKPQHLVVVEALAYLEAMAALEVMA
jgi:hypothetical protein